MSATTYMLVVRQHGLAQVVFQLAGRTVLRLAGQEMFRGLGLVPVLRGSVDRICVARLVCVRP